MPESLRSQNMPVESGGYYFVGIGGCGMSALAHILLDCGLRVAGSDLRKSVYTEELEKRGVTVFYSHSSRHIESFDPAVVIYSSAIARDNPELLWAKNAGKEISRRGEFLASMVKGLNPICVAGMHGKTTTSAMLAFVFEKLDASLGHSIGWRVPQLKTHGKINKNFVSKPVTSPPSYFTVETDESDGTFTLFSPLHSIVLNIDREHMDYFGDFNKLRDAFFQFVQQTSGFVIYCADNEPLRDLLKDRKSAISYGLSESATYRVKNYSFDPGKGGWNFEVFKDDALLGRFKLQLLGLHNVLNATAVVALLDQLKFKVEDFAPAVASFKGAFRRQEEIYNDGFIRIFDDYGHHPQEIIATIKAIKPLINNRLLVVFQPHRYTRTRDLLKDFGLCFAGASKIWVMDVYGAGEEPIPGITGERIVQELKKNGFDSMFEPSEHVVAERVLKELQIGDVVLFCGAGDDVTKAARKLANILGSKVYGSDYGECELAFGNPQNS